MRGGRTGTIQPEFFFLLFVSYLSRFKVSKWEIARKKQVLAKNEMLSPCHQLSKYKTVSFCSLHTPRARSSQVIIRVVQQHKRTHVTSHFIFVPPGL